MLQWKTVLTVSSSVKLLYLSSSLYVFLFSSTIQRLLVLYSFTHMNLYHTMEPNDVHQYLSGSLFFISLPGIGFRNLINKNTNVHLTTACLHIPLTLPPNYFFLNA